MGQILSKFGRICSSLIKNILDNGTVANVGYENDYQLRILYSYNGKTVVDANPEHIILVK